MKKRIMQISLFFLAAVLVFSGLSPALAVTQTEQKHYIVKYRQEVLLADESQEPFAVLDRNGLAQAMEAGVVDWYEEDYEAVLLEDEWAKWDLSMIGAKAASTQGYKGQGIRIAVVDSGVAPHPDLNQNIMPGYNYVDNTADTTDTNGHGTFVCGILAAVENGKGIVGVAPRAKLVPLKCFSGKSANVSTICKAIYAAVDTYRCQVINLSFALKTTSGSKALQEAIDHAVSKGAIVVAAAGNSGTTELNCPACFDNVLGVGAVDQSGNVWASSQRNSSVFLTAPGVNLTSTSFSAPSGYHFGTGTSFAAPQVAGAAAVLLSMNPKLNFTQISKLLQDGAVDRGLSGYDTAYGHGILNLGNSVKLAQELKAYAISAQSGLGGTVTLSASSAYPGSRISFTVNAGSGYFLQELVVKDSTNQTIPIIQNPDGTYAFTMPETHVTLKASFLQKLAVQFSDVPSNAYYARAVTWAAERKITTGTSQGIFSPSAGCTRGQVVTFLWRAAGCPSASRNGIAFADVHQSDFFASAVAWASQLGITKGTSANRFSPNAVCTREQIVTFLWRFAGTRGDSGTAPFDLTRFQDASRLSAYAVQPAQWACSKNILQGDGKALMPKETCSRGQIVTFLYRYMAYGI